MFAPCLILGLSKHTSTVNLIFQFRKKKSKIAALFSNWLPWSTCVPNFKVLSIEVNSNLFFVAEISNMHFKFYIAIQLHVNLKFDCNISRPEPLSENGKCMWKFRWSSRKCQKKVWPPVPPRGEGGLKDLQMDTMITKWKIRKIWEDPPPHPT